MMKTDRERFLAILAGEVPDKTLWVSRLNIWHTARTAAGTLPDKVAGMSLPEIESFLGMGHSARGARVYRIVRESVEEKTFREGDRVRHVLVTPRGEVSCVRVDSPQQRAQGMASVLIERYLKSESDYDVMAWVESNTLYIPDYEACIAYDREVGSGGLPVVGLEKSPAHKIMLDYAGYENFYYHLADFPGKVQMLIEAMEASYQGMWDVVAGAPVRLVLHGTHFHSEMTPPPVFEKYFMPYFQAFNARMHQAGKRVGFHADADLSGLLEMVRDCGFDIADTFACAPLVRTTFDQARAAWKDRIVIWGGVPSIILEPDYPQDKFRRYMTDLEAKTRNTSHFIMAVSDNVMPAAELSRLEWIRDLFYGA